MQDLQYCFEIYRFRLAYCMANDIGRQGRIRSQAIHSAARPHHISQSIHQPTSILMFQGLAQVRDYRLTIGQVGSRIKLCRLRSHPDCLLVGKLLCSRNIHLLRTTPSNGFCLSPKPHDLPSYP